MNKEVYLKYKPTHLHEDFKTENGVVTLIFRYNDAWSKFIGWLVKKPKVRYLELDGLGSYFWLQCDGVKVLSDIIVQMSEKFNDPYDSMEHRILKYSSHLAVKGWLGFIKK